MTLSVRGNSCNEQSSIVIKCSTFKRVVTLKADGTRQSLAVKNFPRIQSLQNKIIALDNSVTPPPPPPVPAQSSPCNKQLRVTV